MANDVASILIKILPPEGTVAPSIDVFENAFKAFFALPSFKTLFAQQLKEGNICLTFKDQQSIAWLPATREITLPLSLLNGPLIILFENIATIICLISNIDNPVLAQRLMMLRQQQTPELFDHFAASINTDRQKLVHFLVTMIGEEKLNDVQEQTIMLAQLNVNYDNVDKDRALRLKRMFELLVETDVFKDLLNKATIENPISLQFVDKQQLRTHESVMYKPGGFYYIDNEADLINITDTLMKHFADSKHTVFKYADYKTADEYAIAILKASFDANCSGAQHMIALFKSSKAQELMGNYLQKPTSDPVITPALMTILEMYQKAASAHFEHYISENQDYFNSMKLLHLAWQQKNSVPCSSTQVVEHPEPMVESFKQYLQMPQSVIGQTMSVYEQLIACVDRYKSYACSDARNYTQCVNPDKKAEVIKRYADKPVHLLRYEAQANQAAHAVNGQYSEHAIKHIGKLIELARSGCCTTFAVTALSKLLPELSDCRFQMLTSQVEGHTAHCFLLVEDHKTTQMFVVDPWLASLGWDGVYTIDDYPFSHYFKEGLHCVFDSEKMPSPRMLTS